MSEPNPPTADPENERQEEPPSGPNLVLLYSILAVVLLAAIAVAALIVLPFYQRR